MLAGDVARLRACATTAEQGEVAGAMCRRAGVRAVLALIFNPVSGRLILRDPVYYGEGRRWASSYLLERLETTLEQHPFDECFVLSLFLDGHLKNSRSLPDRAGRGHLSDRPAAARSRDVRDVVHQRVPRAPARRQHRRLLPLGSRRLPHDRGVRPPARSGAARRESRRHGLHPRVHLDADRPRGVAGDARAPRRPGAPAGAKRPFRRLHVRVRGQSTGSRCRPRTLSGPRVDCDRSCGSGSTSSCSRRSCSSPCRSSRSRGWLPGGVAMRVWSARASPSVRVVAISFLPSQPAADDARPAAIRSVPPTARSCTWTRSSSVRAHATPITGACARRLPSTAGGA